MAEREVDQALILTNEEKTFFEELQSKGAKLKVPVISRVFAVIGAWLSALFFTAFIAVGGMMTETFGAFIIFGIIYIAIAIAIQRKETNNFTEPFSFAILIVGYLLFVGGMVALMDESFNIRRSAFTTISVVSFLIQIPVFFFSRSKLHQFFAVMLAVYAIHIFIISIGLFFVSSIYSGLILISIVLLITKEKEILLKYKFLINQYSLILNALVLVLLIMWIFPLFELMHFGFNNNIELEFVNRINYFSIFLFGSFILFAKHCIQLYSINKTNQLIIYVSITLVSAILYFHSAIGLGLILIGLGLFKRERYILGMGIPFFLYSLSAFYYYLGISLLNKSFMLMGIGALFLIAYFIFQKRTSED